MSQRVHLPQPALLPHEFALLEGKRQMKRWPLVLLGVLLVGVSGYGVPLFFANETDHSQISEVMFQPDNPRVVSRGRKIYRAECAACHGTKLEGQPDWRRRMKNGRLPAPPHDATGHTWHHPEQILFDITKYGPAFLIKDSSYQSDMPAYKDVLSDEDIVAVLSFIKSQWPERIKARHGSLNEAAGQQE